MRRRWSRFGEFVQQGPDFGAVVAAMSTGSARGTYLAFLGPAGNGFGIDVEKRRDFSRSQQLPIRTAIVASSRPDPINQTCITLNIHREFSLVRYRKYLPAILAQPPAPFHPGPLQPALSDSARCNRSTAPRVGIHKQ